jgi:hypothetical protein
VTFLKVCEGIRDTVQYFLLATPTARLESEGDSDSLAVDCNDLDYIISFCGALESLCRVQRGRRYEAYVAAKEKESRTLKLAEDNAGTEVKADA